MSYLKNRACQIKWTAVSVISVTPNTTMANYSLQVRMVAGHYQHRNYCSPKTAASSESSVKAQKILVANKRPIVNQQACHSAAHWASLGYSRKACRDPTTDNSCLNTLHSPKRKSPILHIWHCSVRRRLSETRS
jgi:hypothetical protein